MKTLSFLALSLLSLGFSAFAGSITVDLGSSAARTPYDSYMQPVKQVLGSLDGLDQGVLRFLLGHPRHALERLPRSFGLRGDLLTGLAELRRLLEGLDARTGRIETLEAMARLQAGYAALPTDARALYAEAEAGRLPMTVIDPG